MKATRKPSVDIHPDMAALTHLMEGRPTCHAMAMAKNIGKRCRFIAPKKLQYPAYREGFTIQALQYIWDGSRAYRVVGDSDVDKFGCPARPEEIDIVAPLRRVQ